VRDLRGLPTQITDGRGIVTNMTYDNAGRILTRTYPAATAENLTYTYDAVSATNWGKGRLTKLQSQSVTIDLAYDQRGNTKSDKRTIATKIHTTTYEYDLADRIYKVNYPSGRIVTYNRDTMGRINQVTTKKTSADASVTLANTVVYRPLSRNIESFAYGNGLTESTCTGLRLRRLCGPRFGVGLIERRRRVHLPHDRWPLS
jgi:YD repeat-containing protein